MGFSSRFLSLGFLAFWIYRLTLQLGLLASSFLYIYFNILPQQGFPLPYLNLVGFISSPTQLAWDLKALSFLLLLTCLQLATTPPLRMSSGWLERFI
jgi:hypothetical protein